MNFDTNESWRWHDGAIHFEVLDGGNPIQCRVDQEWIEDKLGDPGAEGLGLNDMACFDAAKAAFDPITDLVGPRITGGLFEPDGSIRLRSPE